MNMILWIYFGLMVGLVSTIVDSRANASYVKSIVFSVLGAVAGGFLVQSLFSQSFSQIPLTFIAFIIGVSLITLMIERVIQTSRKKFKS